MTSRESIHYLDGGETTINLPIGASFGAVIFAYWLGNAGHNGTHIVCFTVRKSSDGSAVTVNNLDGSTSTITATCDYSSVKLDLASLSQWGYIRLAVFYL